MKTTYNPDPLLEICENCVNFDYKIIWKDSVLSDIELRCKIHPEFKIKYRGRCNDWKECNKT